MREVSGTTRVDLKEPAVFTILGLYNMVISHVIHIHVNFKV